MLVDSHCHLDFPEFAGRIPQVIDSMKAAGVAAALCVAVSVEGLPAILRLAESHRNLFASVGVHPDHREGEEPSVDLLVELAARQHVLAIGETGLDYHWHKGDTEWQRVRFRNHIRAARLSRKPLIVHTRDAAEDTLRIMEEEGAGEIGGVMHCFTETIEVAERAIEMGFHISFSGIVTFKNAKQVREVARVVPIDRVLVETDAPYLAPVPHRGKPNEPAFVHHVAGEVAALRGIPLAELGDATTANFCRLFQVSVG
jgi:TatD DNase family protein